MASSIKGITVKLGADTTALSTALKDVDKESRSLQTELKTVERLLKLDPTNTILLSQKQELLAKQVNSAKDKLKLLSNVQEQIKDKFTQGEIDEGQYRAFEREVAKTQGELKKFSSAVEEAGTKSSNADEEIKGASTDLQKTGTEAKNAKSNLQNVGNEFDSAGKKANKTGDEIKKVGEKSKTSKTSIKDVGVAVENAGKKAKDAKSGFTIFKGAVANLVSSGISSAVSGLKSLATETINTGKSFEAQMSKVASIANTDKAGLDKLTESAKKMGASTVFTAEESGQALEYMAMAGWNVEQSTSALGGVLNLAAASGEDLGTTSDIVTDAMTAFGLKANDANHFADVLAKTATSANTDVGKMGETFKYVASLSGSLGYSVEDVGEQIGLMANNGIKSTQAGTSLRAIMTRLSTDAGASAKSLGALGTLTEKLGVQFYDSNGKARALSDVINESRQAWRGLTAEEQTNYAKKIAGTNAISGWMALMNSSETDVNNLSSALKNCNGTAEEMANEMIDNLDGDMKILSSTFQDFQISIFENAESPLRDMVQTVSGDVIPALKGMVTGVKGSDKEFGNAIGKLVNTILSNLIQALPQVVNVGMSLITTLANGILQAIPKLTATVVKIVSRLITSLTQQIPRLTQQLPKIITTIINVLIKAVPRILAAGTKLLSAIVKAIPRVVISLTQQLPSIINTISTTLLNSIDVIINAAVQMLSGIIDAIPQVIDALLQALPKIINTTVRTLVKALPKIINGAIKMLMGIIKAIPKIISAIVKNLPRIITCIVNGLINSIDAIIKGGIQLMMGLIKAIPIFITKLIPQIPKIVITIVKTLIKNLPTLIKGAVQLFMGIVKAIPKMLVELVKNLPQIIVAIVKGLASLGKEMWNIGKNVVQGLWNGIKNCVKWIKDKISGFVDGVVDGIKDFFGIHSPSTVMRDEVGRFVGEGIGVGIADSTKGVVANAKDQMRQVVDAYSSFDMPTLTPAIAGIATNSNGQLVADSNVLQSTANTQSSNGMTFTLNVDNFNNYSDNDLQSITRRMSELLAADIAQQQKAW